MRYMVVYDSQTGNTRKLAQAIVEVLSAYEVESIRADNPAAVEYLAQAERIYAGFWTDKGDCTVQMAELLSHLSGQDVFLFGTAGFGSDQAYFDAVLARVALHLSEKTRLLGGYMCQGHMLPSVKERYQRIARDQPEQADHMKRLIDNFDQAQGHPTPNDLRQLQLQVQAMEGL